MTGIVHRYQESFFRAIIILTAICLVVVTYGYRSKAVAIALITKVVPEVSRKSSGLDWTEASKGDMLTTGDQVRTGKKSLAIIKFLDKSYVRLREESELTINGQVIDGKFTKSTHLSGGAVGFDVERQRDEQFRLTSPTSVASIRGTKGKWAGGLGRDTLVVVEGLVNLLNNASGRAVDVATGFVGFSNDDGSVSTRRATPEELADARSAIGGESTNELELEFRDSEGNTKQLKLKYKQE